MSDQQTPPTQPETLYVENMDHFIALLFAWHENKVKTLEHMMSIPEGTEVTFGDEMVQVLSNDVLKGFQIGLSLALIEMGQLPFMAEPAADDTPTASNDSEVTSH